MDPIRPHSHSLIWLFKNPEIKRRAVSETVQVNLFGCSTCLLICSACLRICSLDLPDGGPVGQHMEDALVCIYISQILDDTMYQHLLK